MHTQPSLKSKQFSHDPLADFAWYCLRNAAEHIVFLYVEQTVNAVEAAAGEDPALLMSKDPKVKRAFDALLAVAAKQVTTAMPQLLASAEAVLQQAGQTLQKMMPPPPMDPAAAAVQAATQETQRKGAADQQTAALKREELAIKAQGVQQQGADASLAADTKVRTTAMDNQTATEIAELKIGSGQGSGFSDGASLTGR